MNKVRYIENIGFKIPWKLLNIGLCGHGEIPAVLNRNDISDYLTELLTETNEQTDNIIALICERQDYEKFDSLLKRFSNEDGSDINIQKRKWRVYLLKTIMENISEDYLQGLLELMDFWVSMGIPDDCPQSFPNSDNKRAVQDYFTSASFTKIINDNNIWLDKEIADIINLEKDVNGTLC